eukprot:scaffold20791_cov26-Tisochrysis_lutea.AAC.1
MGWQHDQRIVMYAYTHARQQWVKSMNSCASRAMKQNHNAARMRSMLDEHCFEVWTSSPGHLCRISKAPLYTPFSPMATQTCTFSAGCSGTAGAALCSTIGDAFARHAWQGGWAALCVAWPAPVHFHQGRELGGH